jgi:hydrogenase nickel incorporation protein HypB
LAFEKADIIILSKIDLLPYVDFDEEFFMKGIRHLNATTPVFKVNGKTGEGFDKVAAWLQERSQKQ